MNEARHIQTYPDGEPRLPEGQHVTTKFPVLTYGPTPQVSTDEWSLRMWGACEHEIELRWSDLEQFTFHTLVVDFHCVTTWSRMDTCFGGYLLRDIFALAQPTAACSHVMQHAYGDYTTNNPYNVLLDDDVLLVTHLDGAALPPDHGGPARVHVPKRWAWKGAKWVNGFEFLETDQRGFWEVNGYHTNADPWGAGGERYSSQERAFEVRKEGNRLRRENP
jgi:DMSO/TMAO reductase YedYZ molybdopterin-dependent catalytic subunit